MKNQEIFNRVVRHLRTQGKAARDTEGNCYYRICRNNEVLKCAAGCLIEDENYTSDIEHHSVERVMANYDDIFPVFEDMGGKHLLARLQAIHDQSGVGSWEFLFKEVANEWNLELPE